MPSGAKKRKAAKKKRENQDQLNNPSDSAAVHAHPHGESNVEEIGEDSSVEEEIKIEDELELGKNDGITNPNEEIKKPCDGDSSASSGISTSSDDESHGIKKEECREGSDSLSGKTVESTQTNLDQNEGEAQHMKDTVLAKPLVAPSPYPVRKTSWEGCCGLFEVFSASGA